MEEVYIIIEQNIDKSFSNYIGVADSKDNWEAMINNYYKSNIVGFADKTYGGSLVECVYRFYSDGDEINVTVFNRIINKLQ